MTAAPDEARTGEWTAALVKGLAERRQRGELASEITTRALRLWYGPGEARNPPLLALKNWAVDGYGRWLWITEWESGSQDTGATRWVPELAAATRAAYEPEGYLGAVMLRRPARGEVPGLPELLWGEVPAERFEVREGPQRFWIGLREARHPGLFLDHAPLRASLASSGACDGLRVLNTFAYTGSLGIAALHGGASEVTTLDLSKATLAWARENFELNSNRAGGGQCAAHFIAGDFFEEVPRLRRRGRKFDLVISDPPSFSRGRRGNFSTSRDLGRLHDTLFSVLSPGGRLITSINSANIRASDFEAEVLDSAGRLGLEVKLVDRIEQPPSFPVFKGEPRSGYLKGLVLKVL
jgi:23S rRNA (cytosine1962-C5)-methyltransferase